MVSFLDKASRVLDRTKHSLGEDIVYTPQGESAVSVRAIWNNGYEEIDPDSEALITSNNPRAGVKLADLPVAPQQGDAISFLSVDYKVVDIHEDGQGAVELLLYKV